MGQLAEARLRAQLPVLPGGGLAEATGGMLVGVMGPLPPRCPQPREEKNQW